MCIPIQYSVTWAHTSSAVSHGARLCRTHGHSHIQSSSTSFYSLNNKIKTCRTQRFPLGNTNKCSKKVSRLWFQTKVSRLWSQRKWPVMCTALRCFSTTGHLYSCPIYWEIWAPPNTWFPGPTRVHVPIGISIDSSVSARLMAGVQSVYLICENAKVRMSETDQSKIRNRCEISRILDLETRARSIHAFCDGQKFTKSYWLKVELSLNYQFRIFALSRFTY